MYQKIVVVGNVGNEPQLRYTPDGTPVCNFSVATNRKWSKPDGEKGEETVWFRITVWRRMAEVCHQYIQKGRQVLVEGTLKPDPETGDPHVYQRNDGSYGAQYEVTAATVKFLGRRGEEGAPGTSGEAEPAGSDAPGTSGEPEPEIPF